MSLRLISATPSPYARINRIALLEKNIPFTLESEIPWHVSETQTPKYNPLEKLPVLIFPDSDGREPVYDSAHIQEYIVQKWPNQGPKLITGDLDKDLKLRQIQVLCEGIMDAVVLAFFEKSREVKSQAWLDRQERKIAGGFRALEELAIKQKESSADSEWLLYHQFTIADIAVVVTVGFCEFNKAVDLGQHPALKAYSKKIDERESFKSTRPVMFDLRRQEVI
jgi:glutathione S-transferase